MRSYALHMERSPTDRETHTRTKNCILNALPPAIKWTSINCQQSLQQLLQLIDCMCVCCCNRLRNIQIKLFYLRQNVENLIKTRVIGTQWKFQIINTVVEALEKRQAATDRLIERI
uniref:Uncharacterized protein n=1 Tax=Ceratitis capitata TaxID=7213 RepID=W8BD73_CERCA